MLISTAARRPLPDGEKNCHLKIVDGERILAPGAGPGTPSKATPRKRKGMQDDDPAFHFDKVFAPDCQQEDVFGAVLNNSVASVLEGFNATVLAYGQTGAGKTYKCVQSPPPYFQYTSIYSIAFAARS